MGTLKKESIFAVHRTHNQDTSGLTNHTTHTTHKTAEPTTRGLKKMEASARGGIERAAHRGSPTEMKRRRTTTTKGKVVSPYSPDCGLSVAHQGNPGRDGLKKSKGILAFSPEPKGERVD